jgi:hypothetical protein
MGARVELFWCRPISRVAGGDAFTDAAHNCTIFIHNATKFTTWIQHQAWANLGRQKIGKFSNEQEDQANKSGIFWQQTRVQKNTFLPQINPCHSTVTEQGFASDAQDIDARSIVPVNLSIGGAGCHRRAERNSVPHRPRREIQQTTHIQYQPSPRAVTAQIGFHF